MQKCRRNNFFIASNKAWAEALQHFVPAAIRVSSMQSHQMWLSHRRVSCVEQTCVMPPLWPDRMKAGVLEATSYTAATDE